MFIKLISTKQLILSFLLCTTCILGDTLIDTYDNKHESSFTKAILDNLTHGLVGYFTVSIIVNEFIDCLAINEQLLLQLICVLLACLIDVDHFIEAHSFSLNDATNLESRPFLHCSNIPFIILLCFIIGTYFCSFRLNIWLTIVFCAFLSHHTRDSTRRGYWILPYGHTPPIPYYLYITITLAIPFVMIYVLNRIPPNNSGTFSKRYSSSKIVAFSRTENV